MEPIKLSQKPINIVLTGDEKYIMPMGVAMYSIVKNLSPSKRADFFLIVSGWGEKEEEKIRQLKNCNITVIHVEEYLHYFSTASSKEFKNTYIKSIAPYYRLLIPKILPDYVEKAFYFDSDMVADADLSSIYDEFDDDKLCASVIELVANKYYKKILKHLSNWNEFEKFNSNRFKYPYFNAGFFLLNIKLARQLNIFDDFLSFLNTHPNPPYADQDTLNAICGQKYADKMIYLPLNWNVFADMEYNVDSYFKVEMFSHLQLSNAFKNPYIYHYGGANKPWINNKILNYWNVWNNYYNLSPFKTKPLEYIDIKWIKIFKIPFIKIKKSENAHIFKVYFLGFIPIYKKYFQKIKIYFIGIPILKIKWKKGMKAKCYLFNFIPVFSWE